MATIGARLPGAVAEDVLVETVKHFPQNHRRLSQLRSISKAVSGGDPKASEAIAELDRIISEESGHRPKIKQYTIFDYL